MSIYLFFIGGCANYYFILKNNTVNVHISVLKKTICAQIINMICLRKKTFFLLKKYITN